MNPLLIITLSIWVWCMIGMLRWYCLVKDSGATLVDLIMLPLCMVGAPITWALLALLHMIWRLIFFVKNIDWNRKIIIKPRTRLNPKAKAMRELAKLESIVIKSPAAPNVDIGYTAKASEIELD